MNKCGANYPEWYVGIAADPPKRLFNDHNVDKTGGNWIYQDAGDADSARIIEQHLIDVLHTNGIGRKIGTPARNG